MADKSENCMKDLQKNIHFMREPHSKCWCDEPNITEACLLTDTPYPTGKIAMDFYKELLRN